MPTTEPIERPFSRCALALLITLAIAQAIVSTGCGVAADDLTSEEALEQARNSLRIYNYTAGIEHYQAVLDLNGPGSAEWLEARFALAMAHWLKRPVGSADIAYAREGFGELFERYPDSKWAPAAAFNLGRIAELEDYPGDPIDREAARRLYQQVADAFPGSWEAEEAAFRNAHSYFADPADAAAIERGIEALRQWIALHPQSTLTAEAWHVLGEAYLLFRQDLASALDAYERAIEAGGLQVSTQERLLWKTAVVADQLGELDTAVRHYEALVELSPGFSRSFEARMRIDAIRNGKGHELPLFGLGREEIPQ